VYQYRHAKREVREWYREAGLELKETDMPGFHWGFAQ
jgi:hypothetical protein